MLLWLGKCALQLLPVVSDATTYWDHIIWGHFPVFLLNWKKYCFLCEKLRVVTVKYYFFWRVTSADHKCVKTRSQDPMLIYFTSGSTGSPKMVLQSHSSYGIGFATSGRYTLRLRLVSSCDHKNSSKCRHFVSVSSCFFLTFLFHNQTLVIRGFLKTWLRSSNKYSVTQRAECRAAVRIVSLYQTQIKSSASGLCKPSLRTKVTLDRSITP